MKPTMAWVALGSVLGVVACGGVTRTVQTVKDKPLDVALDAASAHLTIRGACEDVRALAEEIRTLAAQQGEGWQVSGPTLQRISERVRELQARLAKIARGGLGTAIAVVADFPRVVETVAALSEALGENPSSVPAAVLVQAGAILERAAAPVSESPRDAPDAAAPQQTRERSLPPSEIPASPEVTANADPRLLRRALLGLFERETSARRRALSDLARLRDARTLPLLLELTRQGPLAPEAIMTLGRFPGLAAVERLRQIALARDFRDEVRRVALESLGEMGVPLAARALFDLSTRLSPERAKEALDILVRRYPAELETLDALANGKASASTEGEKDGELSALLLALHDSRFPSLQDGAALALAGLGDARAIPALAAMLDHPDPARRASALAALGKIADPLASETLARHARQTRAIEEQRACLRALMAQDTAAAAAEVLDLVWEIPGVAGGMAEEAEALVQRRLPERHRLRSLARASDEAVEVEILLDILSPIVARHQSGLRRAAELDADVMPAIVPELKKPSQAEWIIPWLEDRAQADARQILRDYAADRSHPLELRVRAVESLAAQPGLAGVPILEELHGTVEEALREPIRKTITRRYPDIAAARGLTWTETMPVSRAGVVPSALLMALHGAVGMYLVADASDPDHDQLVFLPVLGGAILGAGSSLLLTWKEENFTNAQAVYIASAGVWALGEAGLLGLALQKDDGDSDMQRVGKALAFATQVGGLAFGWLTRDTLGRGWGQQGYMDLSWAIGGLSGLGLSMMLDDDITPKSAGWAMGGGLLGLVLSGTLGPQVKFERGDVLQTLNTMALGAGLSALLVDSLQLDNQVAPSGAALLGMGLGFAAGSWISAKSEVQPLLLLGIDGALVAGGLAGLGLAWQRADYSDEWDSLWILSGSLAGLGTAGLLSRFVSFGPGDGWLAGSAAVYGGWAGALIANAAQPDHERAAAGGILAGVPLGLAAGAVAATYSESRPTDLVMGNLSFLAGNLAGVGALLQFDDLAGRRAPLLLLGGGAAGIAAGALFGRGLEYSGPDRLLMAEATTLGGFSGFGLMRALRPDHETADLGGLALGGALGFAAGAVAAAHSEGSYGEVGRTTLGFGLGGAFGAGLALSLPDLEAEPFWGLLLGGAYAGLALDLATEAHTRFSPADRTLVLFGAGWGLYQGLALYGATGSASDVFGERGFWGSAILGGLGGALAAGTLAQWTEIPSSTVGRAATGGLFGSMLGLGLGLMVPELGDEGPLALAMSGGWAGLSVYAFALREARYTGADYLALGLGGGWGLFQGYLIGKASGLEGDPLSGALIFGAGMGLIAGDAFARAADLDFSEVLFTELSAYAGSGLGAGAVMLDEDAGGGTIALASSLGGWGLKTLTGLVAGKLKFRRDDTWEYFLGQAYGVWHGLGLALLGEQTDRELGAGALMGLSAGFLVPMITNQFQDYTFLQDALMAGGASLGTWIGAWGMYALANDDDSILLGALLGGDAGLLLSALALSGALKASEWSVGWTEITSVAGLALGVSFSSIFSKDPRVIAGGMALSTALGWAAGVIWNLAVGAPGASRHAGTPPPPAPVSPPPAPSAATAAEAAIPGGERSFFPRPPVPGMFLLPPPPGNDTLSPVWMVGVQGVMDF